MRLRLVPGRRFQVSSRPGGTAATVTWSAGRPPSSSGSGTVTFQIRPIVAQPLPLADGTLDRKRWTVTTTRSGSERAWDW